jgi:hypothetical protein
MSQSQRQERLRLLVRKLNQERKRQTKQVDILCNDLISANRGFVRRLDGVSFAATFYKALLGTSNLRTLLTRAARLIEQELPGAGVAFFLRQNAECELYALDGRGGSRLENERLEDYFGPELTENICKANKRCTVEDMLGMGLGGNPSGLKGVSIVTLPLNDLGRSLGFILLHRPMPRRLTREEWHKVGLITCGLSHAIQGCRTPIPLS